MINQSGGIIDIDCAFIQNLVPLPSDRLNKTFYDN